MAEAITTLMIQTQKKFTLAIALTTYHSLEELELVSNSQVTPRLCLVLYDILTYYS